MTLATLYAPGRWTWFGSEVNLFEKCCHRLNLKVIYHPLYGMNIDVLIWGDWLSCDPLTSQRVT